MTAEDLLALGPGFADPVFDSQAVFRAALTALSHPGRAMLMPTAAQPPAPASAAAAMLLLGLLDSTCEVWLSASLRSSTVAAWLRFHTGCRWANAPEGARFLWCGASDELPPLQEFWAGTEEAPEDSATCVIEVAGFGAAAAAKAVSLSGPGITNSVRLEVNGLPKGFWSQWQRNHEQFPRGVDVFLASTSEIVGLPRSCRLEPFSQAV